MTTVASPTTLRHSTRRIPSTLTGLTIALRLAWRRSRVFWIVWVLGLVLLMPATVAKYHDLIPAGSNPDAMLTGLGNNPTMRAMLGVPFDLATPGGFTMWRVGTFTAAAVAMMAALGVIRASRAEEEDGRVELLRSGALGRHAPLAAAMILALSGCLAVGVLVAVSMVMLTSPVAGGIAVGSGLALTGAVFVGVGAVFAQVFESARTARYWTLGVALGGLYLLRAMFDAVPGNSWQWLNWANPLEWASLARPYADERWWVFALPLALTALLCGTALRLEAGRDHGAGLRAAKPGRAQGASWLDDAAGLAWRLQRGSIIGWTIGVVVTGLGIGSLATSLSSMTQGNTAVAELMRKLGGSSVLQDAFFLAMLAIMGTVLALAVVTLLNRLHSEESQGRAELMLSTATGRLQYALSHLVWAVGLPSALFVLLGALLPLSEAAATGSWRLCWTYTQSALALLPGLWLVAGVTMLLIGWAPRLLSLVWVLLGWTMFCTWLASLFDVPVWLTNLQPWGLLPKLPSDPMRWTPVIAETLLALALLAAGLLGYRRRDLQTT